MIRMLRILGLVLIGIVGVVLVVIALGSLWSTNYALAYYVNLKSGDVYRAYMHGEWMLPINQARLYAADLRIHHITAVAWVALTVELAAISIFIFVVLVQPFKAKPPLGSARMATQFDLKKAELLNGVRGQSILLGRIGRQEVRYSGDSHFYVNGPTRTGKGRGFVMTNLLEWEGSAVVLDVKQENWNLTAPARMALGQKVFIFAPGSAESHRWNPLDFVRPWPARATDLTNLAKSLVPLSERETQRIWKETAQGLAASLFGYVLDSKTMEGRRHLRSALRMLSIKGGFATALQRVLEEERDLDPFVLDGFRLHLAREAEQRLSFEGNISTAMLPWKNALIAAATSTSDFDIRELRSKPFSLFLGCSVRDFGAAEPILRLLIQQIHDIMLGHMPKPATEPYKILLMLDEFYQFEQVPEIIKRAPLVAGYGMIIALIAQSITQIDDRYSVTTRKAFLGNMEVRLYIAVGDKDTAQIVSDDIGNHYVERAGWSKQQGGRSSSSGRFEFVPLRTAAQIMGLSGKKTLLYIRSVATAELSKLNFYTDRDFVKRRNAIEKLKLELPKPDLEPLPEWPLFEARAVQEGNSTSEATPSAASSILPIDVAEILNAEEGLPEAIVRLAKLAYRHPEKFLNYVRLALDAPEHGAVVAILQGLRTKPAQYGDLRLTPKRSLFRRQSDLGLDPAAMQALRDAVIAAWRAVIDDRARRYSAAQAAAPTAAAILDAPWPSEPITETLAPQVNDAAMVLAGDLVLAPCGIPVAAMAVIPPAPPEDDFAGLPLRRENAPPELMPGAADDDSDIDIHEIAGSTSELDAMERIVESIVEADASTTQAIGADSLARLHETIASVRRLIDLGLSDDYSIFALGRAIAPSSHATLQAQRRGKSDISNGEGCDLSNGVLHGGFA